MSIAQMQAAVERLVRDDLSNPDRAARHQVANALFAPTFVDHTNPPELKYGIESHKAVVDLFHAAFTDMVWRIDDIFAAGDRVCARMTMTGVHTGDFFGIAPTGRAVTFGSTHIARIADGRIAEHWGNTDDLLLMRQMGVLPEPVAAIA